MDEGLTVLNSFLEPGHVYLPAKPTQICAVVGYGVVVTVYDQGRRQGGMCHYLYPFRKSKKESTALFAGPAIVALVKMFFEAGAAPAELEAHLFGGAWETGAEAPREWAEKNVTVGVEILGKLGVNISGRDVGGQRGRKIVFNSDTGETAILKVNRLRSTDWAINPFTER
ncbi:MAG: chemotaxis protein CheD [Pseudomonadota bacterium]